MAKIYVELRSGLGNQLFQYAFAQSLATESGRELVLCPAYFDSPWKYLLKKALHREARKFRMPLLLRDQSNLRIAEAPETVRSKHDLHIITEGKVKYEDILSAASDKADIYLKGYWQNYAYFHSMREILRHQLQPAFRLSDYYTRTLKSIDEHCVAIHVRRGDFLTNKAFGACSLAYYQKAIAIILKEVSNPRFIVFSNDSGWVKESFGGLIPYELYSNNRHRNTDIEEMFLMSRVQSLIIPNSTFSWWSAYLGDQSRRIITPGRWFLNEKLQQNAGNLLLKGWNVLDNELILDE